MTAYWIRGPSRPGHKSIPRPEQWQGGAQPVQTAHPDGRTIHDPAEVACARRCRACLGGRCPCRAGARFLCRCAACHNATKDAGPKIGPDLWGVYGRKAASAKFNYSAALKAQKITWNDATLDKWLTGPMQMVPGTMMSFPGLKDPAKRAEIIAYLKTLH
jgi:cytochrome c